MTDQILPRHVLCLLASTDDYPRLMEACEKRIAAFGGGFEIDREYSENGADDRMSRAFEVSWDRVHPEAYADADIAAVESHGGVIYLLSSPLRPGTYLEQSAIALELVAPLFDEGLSALKGETAGVAHGIARWRSLAAQAAAASAAGDRFALASACRLAWTRRPISSDGWLESVGNHLIGLPEVAVDDDLGSAVELSFAMDAISDHLFRYGVEATLPLVRGELHFSSDHDEDDLKFNPYGMVWCDALLSEKPNSHEATQKKKTGLFGFFK
jgi:hypothetical protein